MSARVIIEVRHGCAVTRIERNTTEWGGDAEPEEIVAAVQSAADEVKRIFTPPALIVEHKVNNAFTR